MVVMGAVVGRWRRGVYKGGGGGGGQGGGLFGNTTQQGRTTRAAPPSVGHRHRTRLVSK